MGGRRFVEGLYQALFSFRDARQNAIQSETKIEPDLRLHARRHAIQSETKIEPDLWLQFHRNVDIDLKRNRRKFSRLQAELKLPESEMTSSYWIIYQ